MMLEIKELILRMCSGAMYDDQGNLANWWTKASLAHFYAREECLVEEYNQCQIQGFHVS